MAKLSEQLLRLWGRKGNFIIYINDFSNTLDLPTFILIIAALQLSLSLIVGIKSFKE